MHKFKVDDVVVLKASISDSDLKRIYARRFNIETVTGLCTGDVNIQLSNGLYYSEEMLELAPKFKVGDRVKFKFLNECIKGKIVHRYKANNQFRYAIAGKTRSDAYSVVETSIIGLCNNGFYTLIDRIKSLFRKTKPVIINIKLKTKRAIKLNFNN